MAITETKNYGLIKAIHVGVNPPLNTKIIWYDDNQDQKIHKYYNVELAQWVPLGGSSPVNVSGMFCYIAFATDCEGSNFSLTKQPNSETWAIISSGTEIAQNELIPALFEGKWTYFCDSVKSNGNFTYVRYADDCEGTNISEKPSYEVNVNNCNLLSSGDYNLGLFRGSFTLKNITEGIEIDFNDAWNGNVLEIDLTEDGSPIIDNEEKFIRIIQEDSWTNDPVGSSNTIDLIFNDTLNGIKKIENNPNSTTEFIVAITGSKITLDIPATNTGAVTGTIKIQIGNKDCANDQTTEYRCRNYMAIINSDTEIVNITKDLFEDYWIPISCGCGGSNQDDSNSLAQIRAVNDFSLAAKKELKNEQILQKQYFDNKILQKQQLIEQLEKVVNNNELDIEGKFNGVQNTIGQHQNSINDINQSINSINISLQKQQLITKLQADFEQMISDFFDNNYQAFVSQTNSDIEDIKQDIQNLQNP